MAFEFLTMMRTQQGQEALNAWSSNQASGR